MSSALPLASVATVDVALGATVTTNDNNADGTVVPPSSTKDEGEYVGELVEIKAACFGAFAFADGA